MANQWNNAVIIADKMLEFFDGLSEIGSVVNRDYESEFMATKQSVGQTIYVEKPPRFVTQDGPTITSIQDMNVGKIPVVINKWKTVPVKLNGLDLNFNAKQFDIWADKYLKPIVSPLANAVDIDLFGLYNQIYNFAGTPATGPTTYDVIANAKEILDYTNTPQEDRVLFLNPTAERRLTNGIGAASGTIMFNPQRQVGDMVMSGFPFKIAGFEPRSGNNVATHTSGTARAIAASTTASGGGLQMAARVAGAGQLGSLLNVDEMNDVTNTFVKGDIITIYGVNGVVPSSKVNTGILQQFVVTQSTVAAASAVTLSIDPPIITSGAFQTVNAGPADNAAIRIVNSLVPANAAQTYAQNLAFWKKALGLVTVPVKAPKGLNGVTRTYNGMSITLSYGSDIYNFEEIWRADIVYGVVVFYPENCVRITN